jgi:alkaline phosphatase
LSAATAGSGWLSAVQAQASAGDEPTGAPGKPRNIIFMVSDGMSAGVLSLAQLQRQQRDGRSTAWMDLLSRGDAALGLFQTASLDSPVTDSSAASSAWGSGSRVCNGQLNILPDGRKLTPIARLVKDSGRHVGLVTTATVTHATPAGFAAVQDSRQREHDIAPQYLDLVDVILGGGRMFFSPDLLRQYEARGYHVLRQASELPVRHGADRVLGLFDEGHLPFSVDRDESDAHAAAPTLAAMTEVALSSLSRRPRGFLLQVEGARIDHAAHANDAPALLGEQLAFDDALGVVLAFARMRGDTLVVVTTDHGNSNPGLIGLGSGYSESGPLFAQVGAMKGSCQQLLATLSREPQEPTVEQVQAAAAKILGIAMKPLHAELVAQMVHQKSAPLAPHVQGNSVAYAFGQIMSHYTAVGWTGISHTADPALVTATGPGAQRFAGVHAMTDAFAIVTELLDCPHRNPSMTWQEFEQLRKRGRPQGRGEGGASYDEALV